MPRIQRLVLALLALGLLCQRPSTALAHAALLRSVPAAGIVLPTAPKEVQLWFSESISLPSRALEVTGPDGRRVDMGPAHVAADDADELIGAIQARAPGTYVVRWKVISADTHPVWDSFTFSVGAASTIVSPADDASPAYTRAVLVLQVAGRWLHLLGSTLVIGPLMLWSLILDAAIGASAVSARAAAWRRIRRLTVAGAAVLAVGALLSFVAQMTSLANTWSEALAAGSFQDVFDTRLGIFLTLDVAAALFICVVNVFLLSGPFRPAPGRWSLPVALQLCAVGFALLSTSLLGHAVNTDPVWLSILLDWGHLIAMAVWVGGVIGLAYTLPALLRAGGEERRHLEPTGITNAQAPEQWTVLASILPRFSRLALTATLVLTATGIYSALRNVGSLDQLVTTDYGRALSVKLGLVVVVIAIASVNLLVLGPAVRRVAGADAPRLAMLWGLFRPLVWLEAVVLGLILLVVGVLTSVAPARQAGEPTQVGSGTAISVASVATSDPHAVLADHLGSTLVTLAVAPSLVAPAPLAVSLTGLDGAGLVGSVTVRLVPPAHAGLAIIDAPLAFGQHGQFGGSFLLAARGVWQIELTVAAAGKPGGSLRFSLALPLQSAKNLLRRADRVTNALDSIVTEQHITAGTSVAHQLIYDDQRPNREHMQSNEGLEQVRIGKDEYVRASGGAWQHGTLDPEQVLLWPNSQYARTAPDAVVVGSEPVDGTHCTVVAFWLPYPNASYRLWIDPRSGRVLRALLLWPGHFEDDRYHGFNSAAPVVAPRQ